MVVLANSTLSRDRPDDILVQGNSSKRKSLRCSVETTPSSLGGKEGQNCPNSPTNSGEEPDSQTGPVPAPGFPQAASHDPGGGPARIAQDPDRRHCARNHRGRKVGAATRGPAGCGAEPDPESPPAGDPGAVKSRPPFVVESSGSGFKISRDSYLLVRPTAQDRLARGGL